MSTEIKKIFNDFYPSRRNQRVVAYLYNSRHHAYSPYHHDEDTRLYLYIPYHHDSVSRQHNVCRHPLYLCIRHDSIHRLFALFFRHPYSIDPGGSLCNSRHSHHVCVYCHLCKYHEVYCRFSLTSLLQ